MYRIDEPPWDQLAAAELARVDESSVAAGSTIKRKSNQGRGIAGQERSSRPDGLRKTNPCREVWITCAVVSQGTLLINGNDIEMVIAWVLPDFFRMRRNLPSSRGI